VKAVKEKFTWIWSFWRVHKVWLIVLFAMTILSTAIAIAYPLIFKYLIDSFHGMLENGDDFDSRVRIKKIITLILIVGLARTLSNFYPSFRALINIKLEMDIREYFFGIILRKSYRFLQKFRTGDLVTRLTDDIADYPKISWFSCSGIFRALESSSKFTFCIGVMLFMNWKLTLISFCPLPVMLYIFYVVESSLSKRWDLYRQAVSKTNDVLESCFSGIKILKAYNGEERQKEEFRRFLSDRIVIEMNVVRLQQLIHSVYHSINVIGQILVIGVGGWMIIKPQPALTLGEFYAFYVYLEILLWPMLDIPNLFVAARQAFVCIDREEEIKTYDRESDEPAVPAHDRGIDRIEEIVMEDIHFSYEHGRAEVLSGIHLALSRGQKVCIVGKVGCGKSTVLRLMGGILKPAAGRILVNGNPLDEYDRIAFRSLTGYIPQEPILFSETVFENIAFGREIGEREIDESLEWAMMKDEVGRMSRGLQEPVGQRGSALSGGQKQRLTIARALAGKPELLLMDDCTAGLDAQNEERFWGNLIRHFPETTCLMVTHRITTARRADLIYILDDGKIQDIGTHEELLEKNDLYRKFQLEEQMKMVLES
jgi:ATP-binding cassette subfamily B protein